MELKVQDASTSVIDWLESPARWLEALLAWLTVALVVLVFGLVAARYLFSQGWIAGQEFSLWLHAAIFLLGAAAALRTDQHVRVDVLYRQWSLQRQALANLLGISLFLLPFVIFLGWISLDYVAASWRLNEGSREPGGLPALYALKSLIPLTAICLVLQAVACWLRAWRQWRSSDAQGSGPSR